MRHRRNGVRNVGWCRQDEVPTLCAGFGGGRGRLALGCLVLCRGTGTRWGEEKRAEVRGVGLRHNFLSAWREIDIIIVNYAYYSPDRSP